MKLKSVKNWNKLLLSLGFEYDGYNCNFSPYNRKYEAVLLMKKRIKFGVWFRAKILDNKIIEFETANTIFINPKDAEKYFLNTINNYPDFKIK